MIGPADRIRLPEGVELRSGALHDPVRLCSVPVNPSGLVALGAPTPRDAAVALERRHGIDRETALADVLRFCVDLNGRFLLNVAVTGGRPALVLRWLGRVPLVLPLGRLPVLPTARLPVDTSDVRTIARTAPRALARFSSLLLVAGTVVAMFLLGALGSVEPSLALTLGLAVAVSVALHELAHLAALRGVPACVVTRGLRIAVVHRAVSPSRTRAVAASGPAAGVALAVCLLAALSTWPTSEAAAGVLVALLNALGLTVASRDGRTLCGLR